MIFRCWNWRGFGALGATIVTVSFAVTGCGDSLRDIGRHVGLEKRRQSEAPVRVDESLLALTAQSVSSDVSAKAYDHCSQVLGKGVFNTRKIENDEIATARQRRFMCSQTEESLADFLYGYMSEKGKRTSSSSASANIGIDMVEESIPVGLKAGGSSQNGNAQSREYSKEDARAHASNFKSMYCSDSDQSNRIEKTYDMMEQIADENIISAWQSCITKNQGGFFCHAQETKDQILVTMKWDPSDLARNVLPSVKLDWQTMDNLVSVSRALPTQLGAGTGLAVTFRRKDEDKASALQVIASDDTNKVNFACSRSIPAVRKGSMIEHPRCGVALYREGVVETVKGRGPQCGVERYSEARTAACGVETWSTGSDLNCPGSRPAQTYKQSVESNCGGKISEETLTCREGTHKRVSPYSVSTSLCSKMELQKKCVRGVCVSAHVPVVRDRETATFECEMPGIPASCAAERFGVDSYKLCRHESHGVEMYGQCSHKGFGEIKERLPKFGVERYNSCFVYFDER